MENIKPIFVNEVVSIIVIQGHSRSIITRKDEVKQDYRAYILEKVTHLNGLNVGKQEVCKNNLRNKVIISKSKRKKRNY